MRPRPLPHQRRAATADGQSPVAPVEGQRLVAPVEGQRLVAPVEGQRLVAPVEGQRLVAPADELRRRVIAERTTEALASLRRQGVRLGRPRRCPDEVLLRVLAEREAGRRLGEICAALNADGVPTPAGGERWYPSHLSRLLRTQDARIVGRSSLVDNPIRPPSPQ
ncbi:recombinase family protein [Actinoplanes sp. LDG1-06]|uniref:Recombinase family protein n=1 Tax=Paractinoplanes ovalisporus TaxID=2810368 RepID=A0ABS2API5_9ACTN|nr:recombinase family protein [Actinoplanes ovalisporus]MBM2621293.1 recombinase family protein [Actinoplanes ovalisporus]